MDDSCTLPVQISTLAKPEVTPGYLQRGWSDRRRKIGKRYPLLGRVMAGPPGEAIGGLVAAVADAFGLTPDAKPGDIYKKIQQDPQAGLKLLEIQNRHKERIIEFLIRIDEMHLADRANARMRETRIAESTGKRDVNQYVLAWVIVCGFFGLTTLLVFKALPTGASQVIFMLFGGLATAFGGVVQYYFGSSKSSTDKTQMLAQLQKREAPL